MGRGYLMAALFVETIQPRFTRQGLRNLLSGRSVSRGAREGRFSGRQAAWKKPPTL